MFNVSKQNNDPGFYPNPLSKESVDKVSYSPESQRYDMKMLGILDKAKDLPKYYPPQENTFDTTISGYYKSVEEALTSDLDQANFTWTLGLNKNQLDEWANLDPNAKQQIIDFAHSRKATLEAQQELYDDAEKEVKRNIQNGIGNWIKSVGMLAVSSTLSDKELKRQQYLKTDEGFRAEVDKIYQENLKNYNTQTYNMFAASEEALNNTKLAEAKEQDLGTGAHLLPFAAELGDRLLSQVNIKDKTPEQQRQNIDDIQDLVSDFNDEAGTLKKIGAVPLTATYLAFGAVSRTLSAGVNFIAPGLLAGWVDNFEQKEVRDYKQAAGDTTSEAYARLTNYSWQEVQQNAPELAQTYLEFADGDEFAAASMYMAAKMNAQPEVASFVNGYIDTLNQQQLDNINRILQSKDTLGEALVSAFGAYSKYAVGTLTTGATLLAFDEDTRELLFDGEAGNFKAEIKKADYRPSAVLGIDNTFAGNAMDLTLSILGDPLTWLLTPAVTTSTSRVLGQFATKSRVNAFVNQTWVGKQITKEMFEVGIKFEKGEVGIRQYHALFNGFDIETQFKLKNIIKEAAENGDKAPTPMFKGVITDAMLAGQEPLKSYSTLGSLIGGRQLRNLTTSLFGKSMSLNKKADKLKQFNTSYSNLKQLSTTSPSFLQDATDVVARLIGATVDNFDDQLRLYDEFFEATYKNFTDTAAGGTAKNLDDINKAKKQMSVTADYIAYLEGLSGFKVRNVVSGGATRTKKEFINRTESISEAQKLTGRQESVLGVIKSIDEQIAKAQKSIDDAKAVQAELSGRAKKGQLSNSEQRTLDAQKRIIEQNSEKIGNAKNRKIKQQQKLDELTEEVPEAATLLDEQDEIFEGVFNKTALDKKLKILQGELKNIKKATKKLETKKSKQVATLQAKYEKFLDELRDIERNLNSAKTAGRNPDKLQNALDKKQAQINNVLKDLEDTRNARTAATTIASYEQKILKYEDEIETIKKIKARKQTPVETSQGGDQFVRLNPDLSTTGIQEIFDPKTANIFKEMIDEGAKLTDDTLSKSYEKLLKRVDKIENKKNELAESLLKTKKNVTSSMLKTLQKEHLLARRVLKIQARKLQALEKASPQNEIMNQVLDLYTDLAVRAGWHKNPKWQKQFLIESDTVAGKLKGKFRKATQAEIQAGKAIEVPAVVELVGKNKYRVNWEVLRLHLRYDGEIIDVGESLLKQGRIGNLNKGDIKVVGDKIKIGKRTYGEEAFRDIPELDEFANIYDTKSRILKSHNQVVTAQLPISPIEFVLANQAANGSKVSKYMRTIEANELYRKAQWLNNLWIIDKIAKPSTAVVSNADELMFFNSFGNWKNYLKQSYTSKVDNLTLRSYNKKLRKGKDISPELLAKYEAYQTRLIKAVQDLPGYLQQRGMWSQSKFSDHYTLLSSGDNGYYDYMISYVNGLLDDYGFQLYAAGNKKTFANWFETADANYIRGNSVLEPLSGGGNNFYSYSNISADTAWEMYESMAKIYTLRLDKATSNSVWEALKAAAVKRGAGTKADALPPTSLLTKIVVPGVKGRTGGPIRRKLFGKDKPALEAMFADPANFRQGMIAKGAAQNKEAQLRSLFESQGKKVIDRAEVDKIKSQASATDPNYQADMFGASYFDYDLFKRGYVTEDYIKAMADRAAIKDVDKYMLNYHVTTPLGRTARQVFPFGKPWLDFTKRYLTDFTKRANIRGLNISEDSNVFTKALYNTTSFAPNIRRGAYISRVANADLSTENVDFEPFVFLPNGDNFFWVAVPGFGYIPALALGFLSETLDDDEYKKILETVFPYTVFNPDEYQWKTDPIGTMSQYTIGGGMVSYLKNKTAPVVRGALTTTFTGNESRPFNDSIGNAAIQKDQRTQFYQDLDVVMAELMNADSVTEATDIFQSHAAEAELTSLLKIFGGDLVRYTIPARANINANYLDTADDWIDYYTANGLLLDVLDPDTYESLERNPNSDDVKELVIQELRQNWYQDLTPAQKINLGLQDPRIYVLAQAGYEVTREGEQPLSDAEGSIYNVGQVYRPYQNNDQDTMERYEEYVRKGWIAPRYGNDILGFSVYKSFDVKIDAIKHIKEVASELVNNERLANIPGALDVFEPFQEEYAKDKISLYTSATKKELQLVSDDLTITADTSDQFLQSYFALSDFDDDTQAMFEHLGIDNIFNANGLTNGVALNNALIDIKMDVIGNKAYQWSQSYQNEYVEGARITFSKWLQNQQSWIRGGGLDEYELIDVKDYETILNQLDVLYTLYLDPDFGPQHPKFLDFRDDTAKAFTDFAHTYGSFYNPNDTNLQSWNMQWKDNIESWAGPLEWTAPLPPTAAEADDPDFFTFDALGPDNEMIDFTFNIIESDLPNNAIPLNVTPLDVLDGDTMTIDANAPVPLRLRVIGIMANELNHPNEEIASEALRQQIFLEEIVDKSNGRLYYVPDKRFGNDAGKDPFGRKVGWLFVEGGIDGNLPAGLGHYIYFEDHFTPTDRYYRRGSELGPFSDIIVPDYNEWDPGTERYILNND